ncbi:MAG: PKD domain-containing protein [Bacteroidales bacterium]|nr:PKD domain-containing protein [Bacteroidales bacterium]
MKSFEEILKQKLNNLEFHYEEGKWEEFKNYYRKRLWFKKYFFPFTIFSTSLILLLVYFLINNLTYNDNNKNFSENLPLNKSNQYSQVYTQVHNKPIVNDLSNNIVTDKEEIVKIKLKEDQNTISEKDILKENESNLTEVKPLQEERQEVLESFSFKISQTRGCVPFHVTVEPEVINNTYSYTWDFGDGAIVTSPIANHVYNKGGMYNVTLKIIKDNKIISQTSIPIVVYDKPNVSFNYFAENNIIKLVTVKKETEKIFRCIYSFNNQLKEGLEVSFNYYKTGKYDIIQIVENNNGCRDTNYKSVSLTYNFPIFIPTAFSPNNDNINDVFLPIVQDSSQYNFTMQIFDKLWRKIYEDSGPQVKWNGINQETGLQYPQDFYNYIIIATDDKGNKNEFKGKVKLLNQ